MVKSKISMFDVSAEEQRFGKMHSAKTHIPKQKRSIVRKKLIKETALMLFSEKGYLNVSTNEILLRLEERRVGKECRSRWSPYH